MNRSWVVVLLLIVAGTMMSCVKIYNSANNILPDYEFPDSIDRQKCIAYLDTAAVDDWEGIWLMIGNEQYCYLYIERINNNMSASFYTHRILLWNPIEIFFQKIPAGLRVGYLEQGLYDNSKRIVLFEDFIFNSMRLRATVTLDKTHSLMLFDDSDVDDFNVGELGLRRVYPIRSVGERKYKVRYL